MLDDKSARVSFGVGMRRPRWIRPSPPRADRAVGAVVGSSDSRRSPPLQARPCGGARSVWGATSWSRSGESPP